MKKHPRRTPNTPDAVPNVRFWTLHNSSPVRIRLNPDQELTATFGGRTDEGSHWTYTTWTHDGDRVLEHTTSEGRDCDGRYSSQQELAAPLARLNWRPAHRFPGIRWPQWGDVRSRQRDFTAEAAGY